MLLTSVPKDYSGEPDFLDGLNESEVRIIPNPCSESTSLQKTGINFSPF